MEEPPPAGGVGDKPPPRGVCVMFSPMASPSRRGRWIAAAAVAAIVSAPLGWHLSDRLERDNDFCTSCHLTPDRPLHTEIRSGFDAAPAGTLAAVHGGATGERDFRCIDCHGGVGLVGRARVKALAAKDAFWYVVGRFEEPDHMRWPLWDEDCGQCHDEFDTSDVAAWESARLSPGARTRGKPRGLFIARAAC